MSNEKLRYVLFFLIVVGWLFAVSYFNKGPAKKAADKKGAGGRGETRRTEGQGT